MIDGYPETVTITPGDTLILCVSTDHPRFRVDFYRQSANLVFMASNEWQDGAAFARGPAEHDWQWGRHEFTVPFNWPSGVYIAMFFELDAAGNVVSSPEDTTIADGRTAKTLFVVRRKTAPILYKVPLFTYQAYNDSNSPASGTDGGSLYTGTTQVTLRRTGGGTGNIQPSDDTVPPDVYDNSSPRQTFAHWDVPFIRWLETNGYPVDYCTDLDVHENPGNFLASYQLLLSVGHDEYWSADMLANVEAYIQGGGNVAFLSGNICYWRTTLKDNNTAIYVYKQDANGNLVDLWRSDGTRLAGVSYNNAGGRWAGEREAVGYSVQNADHWVFGGTGLQAGDTFGKDEHLVGYECDGALVSDQPDGSVALSSSALADGTPSTFVILGFGKLSDSWQDRPGAPPNATATMGIYTNTGTVFTAATVDWARVLASGEKHVDQITRNVIGSLAKLPILIYGTATDFQGNPIPGATVRVAESDPGIVPGIYTTMTDAAGRYRITLYPGLYTGTYSLDAFGPDIVEINMSLGWIPPGATVTQDLQLTRKGILSGRVVDAAGAPITGAGVFLGQGVPIVGDTRTFSFWANTDAAGHYSIIVDPPGPYRAVAAAASFEDSYPSGITISRDTTTTQNFALVKAMPGNITGEVKDAETRDPVRGATVEAIIEDPSSASQTAKTNADGNYMLSNVLSGRRQISAEAKGYASGNLQTVTVIADKTVLTEPFLLKPEPSRLPDNTGPIQDPK